MANFRFKRGSTAQNLAYTGSVGELTVGTDNKNLHVHDAVNPGGYQTVPLDGSGKVPVGFIPVWNKPNTPTITAPANAATGVNPTVAITSSAFAITGGSDSHIASQWQIASGPDFTTAQMVYDSGQVANLVAQTSSALSVTTQYYVRCRHKGNTTGWSDWSASNSFQTGIAPGEQVYSTAGSYNWTVPAGVTSVSVVAVGGGSSRGYRQGGNGGGLGWKNNIAVTPGATISVVVGAGGPSSTGGTFSAGGSSSFSNILTASGASLGAGGTPTGHDGGGNGGVGGLEVSYFWDTSSYSYLGGGGGAGGYAGNGGQGGSSNGAGQYTDGLTGSGGGGGGGGASQDMSATCPGGGGVGLYGQGSNGIGGVSPRTVGGGGSGGANGSPGGINNNPGGAGGLYGGGGGGANTGSYSGAGGAGAVRIIWGGGRSFPSNAA